MKIAVFGGSFNPIHLGHLAMIEVLINSGKYDKIILVPVGLPPHKETLGVGSEHRLNMCNLSMKDEKFRDIVEVSDYEIKKSNKSYTIDTLLHFREKYRGSQISLVIGEDSAEYFYTWKDYKWILELARVVVFRREKLDSQRVVYQEKILSKSEEKVVRDLRKSYYNRLNFIDAPLFNYSSSKIRENIKKAIDVSLMLPEKVKIYIELNRLYK